MSTFSRTPFTPFPMRKMQTKISSCCLANLTLSGTETSRATRKQVSGRRRNSLVKNSSGGTKNNTEINLYLFSEPGAAVDSAKHIPRLRDLVPPVESESEMDDTEMSGEDDPDYVDEGPLALLPVEETVGTNKPGPSFSASPCV